MWPGGRPWVAGWRGELIAMAADAGALASFLPGRLVRRLVEDQEGAGRPHADRMVGALLLADISGFMAITERLAEPVRFHQFIQFLFDSQWRAIRANCRERNIGIIGDLPIFVAQDSADVWARPDLFELDAAGNDVAALERARAAFRLMDGILDLVPEEETDEELAAWVEQRIAARRAAREARDFKAADAIRAELTERGIAIEDTAGGTRWSRM